MLKYFIFDQIIIGGLAEKCQKHQDFFPSKLCAKQYINNVNTVKKSLNTYWYICVYLVLINQPSTSQMITPDPLNHHSTCESANGTEQHIDGMLIIIVVCIYV